MHNEIPHDIVRIDQRLQRRILVQVPNPGLCGMSILLRVRPPHFTAGGCYKNCRHPRSLNLAVTAFTPHYTPPQVYAPHVEAETQEVKLRTLRERKKEREKERKRERERERERELES